MVAMVQKTIEYHTRLTIAMVEKRFKREMNRVLIAFYKDIFAVINVLKVGPICLANLRGN